MTSARLALARSLSLLAFATPLLLAPDAHAQKKKDKPAPAAKKTEPPAEPTPPAATTAAPASLAPATPEPTAMPADTTAGATDSAEAPPASTEPRPTGWIFDGSLGLPRLKSNETSFAFDVNLGYVGKHWGGGAHASSYTYALQNDGTLNQTNRSRFGLEVRYLSGAPEDDARFEFKAEANSGAYGTNYLSVPTDLNNGGGSSVSQEVSILSRLNLLVGRRARVSERLRYKVELGLGMQVDTYSRTSTSTSQDSSNSEAQIESSTSVRFGGRGEVIHHTVPEVLMVRGEFGASTYQLRRIGIFAGGPASDANALTVTDFRETDLSARLFGDIEKLSFVGLMPGVFVGLDAILITGDRSTSALVPIFGVGIVNASPRD